MKALRALAALWRSRPSWFVLSLPFVALIGWHLGEAAPCLRCFGVAP